MAKAVIIGGTGQIGIETGRRLLAEGWDVTLTSRHEAAVPDGCRHAAINGGDADAVAQIVGRDTDVLMSCVAYDDRDAERLALAGRAAGRIVAISSVSVYCDSEGRTLDVAGERGFPEFPVPLGESDRTVPASPANYSTRKVAMEKALLARATCPVTILRPAAIYGPGSTSPREWWFVKRLLDGRTAIPLAYGGRSHFQTSSVDAIADAVIQAVAGDLPSIVNAVDADCPTVTEIGRTIMAIIGVEADLIGLPDAPYPPTAGVSPWSVPNPIICTSAAQRERRYRDTVAPTIEWLRDHVDRENWRERLTVLARYPMTLFDYADDDRAVALPGAQVLTL